MFLQGLMQQGEFDRAKNAFMQAKKLTSNNTDIAAALKELDAWVYTVSVQQGDVNKSAKHGKGQ